MIPKKPALGLDPRVGTGFRKRSCSTKKLERGDDSKRSHHALGYEIFSSGADRSLKTTNENRSERDGHHQCRLLGDDSEQRESRRRPSRAQSAGRLAPRLSQLVERYGAG